MGEVESESRQGWPKDVTVQLGEQTCIIRTLPISDAQPLFYSWTVREGWNPGLTDPILFSSLDRRGFHVLYVTEPPFSHSSTASSSLTPVCLLSTLIIDEHKGFLGPYITRAEQRGRGFGSLLFDWGMQRLNAAQRQIGLDSTVEQQESYRRRGFLHTAAIEHRYTGSVSALHPSTAVETAAAAIVPALERGVDQSDVHALFAACSQSRLSTPAFVDALLRVPSSHSFLARSPSSGALMGLVVARPAGTGYRVAPLFAEDVDTARALLHAVQHAIGRESSDSAVHIDVPGNRPDALQLVSHVGLRPIFQSVRMSTRAPPPVRSAWVFGSEPNP